MKTFFSRHLGLKLSSLALAYIIWAWVSSRSPGERLVNVNLDLRDTSETVVLDYAPKQIRVRLEGDQTVINRINDGDLIARPALPRVSAPLRRQLQILPEDVKGIPRWGVNLVVVDEEISVSLEPILSKALPVFAHLVGEPPAGFLKNQMKVDPEVVVVRGPSSRLGSLTHITTRDIDLRNQRSTFASRVGLVPPDRHCQFEPETVRVVVTIEEVAPEAEEQ